jgi:hypothetical protein
LIAVKLFDSETAQAQEGSAEFFGEIDTLVLLVRSGVNPGESFRGPLDFRIRRQNINTTAKIMTSNLKFIL